MYYLGIDSSAKSASVCVAEDGGRRLVSESYVNVGLTHSETLMPMVDAALKNAKLSINDVAGICVNSGPGSFTGIRIGVAAAKGLAFANDIKCAGVSTLCSMAYNLLGESCIACCVMDARCNQVYTANFFVDEKRVKRLCEDIAISIEELYNILKGFDKPVIFVGDGAEICFEALGSRLPGSRLASERQRFQNAYGAVCAALDAGSESFKSASLLTPSYLRLPQAERELKLKKDGIMK